MENFNEQEYLDSLRAVLGQGRIKADRTGVGAISLTGVSMRFDLQQGFPLLTTKRMFWRGIVEELLWMLSGSTNIRLLQEKGIHIWDEWADEHGNLGPVYGDQLRAYLGLNCDLDRVAIDQIADLLSGLKENPLSRRHVLTTWNPAQLDEMELPPCHGIATQFVCEPLTLEERAQRLSRDTDSTFSESDFFDRAAGELSFDQKHSLLDSDSTPRYRLSCVMHQRSGDMFLGVPFNIASYSLLTHMIAAECNMAPGDFAHTIGDAHIYSNHVDQVQEQLSREPYSAPTLEINPFEPRVLNMAAGDISLCGYQHHPAIPAPVAV